MNPFGVSRQQQELEPRNPERQLVVLPVTPVTATAIGATQTLLTVDDDKFFQVYAFKVCNTTGSPVSFTMCIVPSAGSAATGNTVYSAESIPANDTVTLAEKGTLFAPQGSTIEVFAGSASALNITLGGVHILGGDPL